MAYSRDFSCHTKRLAILGFSLQGQGRATARLMAQGEGAQVLDVLELGDDVQEHTHPKLFAALLGERQLRLEITGPNAAQWTCPHEPTVEEELRDTLTGFEDWYAHRETFYGQSYFDSQSPGQSGYSADAMSQAREAQDAFVAPILEHFAFDSSIEFGCATGAMVAALKSRGVDAKGFDLSAYAVSQAPKDIASCVSEGDFSILDNEDQVDAIIGQEVFEHIPPQEIPEVFRKAHSVARKWLVMTVPCMPQPGLELITEFEKLPRDADGHPVEGHLVQATWWWWGAQATLAGFELCFEETQRVRRAWGDNSRWWNLFVFKRVGDNSPKAMQQRLDKLLRSCFDPLRQDHGARHIGTGRLKRAQDGEWVIACTTRDRPAHVYYGPYLADVNGEVRVALRVRATKTPTHAAPRGVALHIEIVTDAGTKHQEQVLAQELQNADGWLTKSYQFLAHQKESGLQARLYFTGHIDLEVAWPISCDIHAARTGNPLGRLKDLGRLAAKKLNISPPLTVAEMRQSGKQAAKRLTTEHPVAAARLDGLLASVEKLTARAQTLAPHLGRNGEHPAQMLQTALGKLRKHTSKATASTETGNHGH